jgi:hypothetical protein
MTSKLSKIASAVAFLAIAITGCDNIARIETDAQFTASGQRDKAVAPATGTYEEPEIVVTYDVHA